MPSVPEPTYTLPEDASSEDIYELINTLPLPSRCNAIIIKLSKIKWKFVTSQGSLWLLRIMLKLVAYFMISQGACGSQMPNPETKEKIGKEPAWKEKKEATRLFC